MATDEHRSTQINNNDHYRCSSAFICGQSAFFSALLSRDRFFQATGFTIYYVDDLTQNLIR